MTVPSALYDTFKITPKGKTKRTSHKLTNLSKLKDHCEYYLDSIALVLKSFIHSFFHSRYINRRNSDEGHGTGTRLVTMQGDK